MCLSDYLTASVAKVMIPISRRAVKFVKDTRPPTPCMSDTEPPSLCDSSDSDDDLPPGPFARRHKFTDASSDTSSGSKGQCSDMPAVPAPRDIVSDGSVSPSPRARHVFTDPSSEDEKKPAYAAPKAFPLSLPKPVPKPVHAAVLSSDEDTRRRANDRHRFTESSSEDDCSSKPDPLRMNPSNVLVYEVGNDSSPGDVLVHRIIRREVTSLCVPPPKTWWPEAAYRGWVFLKVADQGCEDILQTDYVKVAVQVVSILRRAKGTCACHGPRSNHNAYTLSFGEVRRFAPTRVAYTRKDGPYLLPFGDEAIRLNSRVESAKIVESPDEAKQRYESSRPMVLNKYGFLQATTQRVEGSGGRGTRRVARASAKALNDTRHMVGVGFQSLRKRPLGVGAEVCCDTHGCSAKFGVTQDDGPGVDRMVYFRTWFHTLSEASRREFITRRNRYEPVGIGKPPKRVWLLEAPTEMQRSVRSFADPVIEVGNKELVPVCSDFFCFVLGVSRNKLFQPTVDSPVFQTRCLPQQE